MGHGGEFKTRLRGLQYKKLVHGKLASVSEEQHIPLVKFKTACIGRICFGFVGVCSIDILLILRWKVVYCDGVCVCREVETIGVCW